MIAEDLDPVLFIIHIVRLTSGTAPGLQAILALELNYLALDYILIANFLLMTTPQTAAQLLEPDPF